MADLPSPDMSHRGSLLCLPDAIWAWPVTRPEDIDKSSLARVFAGGRRHRYPDHRHRHRCLAAAAGASRGVARGEGGAGRDADRSGDPYLQHHDRRAAARRGGADRGAMSGAEAARHPPVSAPSWCAPTILSATHRRCSCRRPSAARCWRSMPSMSRYPGCASRSASRCRAKCGCNGGPTCWRAPAMAASRAIRSRPNCCWRSGTARLPVERLSRLIDEHQFDLYNDPMPTMAALEGYINDTSSALFSLGARDRRAAVRRDRASRAPCRTGARHRAGDGGVAAGRLAASVVRAAAIAGEPRQRHGGSVRGQADAKTARGAGSADRRGAGPSEDGIRAAGERAAAGEAGVPAAGAGWPRPRTDVARRQRSVCASGHIEVADAMDVVAGVAIADCFGDDDGRSSVYAAIRAIRSAPMEPSRMLTSSLTSCEFRSRRLRN